MMTRGKHGFEQGWYHHLTLCDRIRGLFVALEVGFSMPHWLVYGATVGKSKDFVPDDAPGACTNMRRASLELPRALLWSLRCFVLLICFGTRLIGRKTDLTISETKKQKN